MHPLVEKVHQQRRFPPHPPEGAANQRSADMTIDLADVARGRRIVAVAARDMSLLSRRSRPIPTLMARLLRGFRLPA